MKKVLCALIILFGVALDTYFYAFRFLADGLPLVVAVAMGVALEMLLSFAVYNSKRSKVYVAIAVAITAYAVVQTSAGQTFALLSHGADTGAATASTTAAFTLSECKRNIDRLSSEADMINRQLKSLQSVEARATYAHTISQANRRLKEISDERARNMDILLKTSSADVARERTSEERKSIYNFYASIPSWNRDAWLKFIFHFVLSVLIAIMAPIGIISWGINIEPETSFSKQQIEMFVAAAWYRIRNNTGMGILSEIAYNELLQKRGHAVESGVYFALTNKCVKLGLINTSGYALEKDHQKVIKALTGEKENILMRCTTCLNYVKKLKQSVFSRSQDSETF